MSDISPARLVSRGRVADSADLIRCCVSCGRWGTRGFVQAPDSTDYWVCANDRSCRRRSEKSQV